VLSTELAERPATDVTVSKVLAAVKPHEETHSGAHPARRVASRRVASLCAAGAAAAECSAPAGAGQAVAPMRGAAT